MGHIRTKQASRLCIEAGSAAYYKKEFQLLQQNIKQVIQLLNPTSTNSNQQHIQPGKQSNLFSEVDINSHQSQPQSVYSNVSVTKDFLLVMICSERFS